MWLNNSTKVSKLEELEKKSEATITVFKNVLSSLEDINAELIEEKSIKEANIKQLKDDISTLTSREAKNKKFISKLAEFFE